MPDHVDAEGVIHLGDLAAPELTDVQRSAVDYAGTVATDFSLQAVLDAAAADTGLVDFGRNDFEVRLAHWLAAADGDTGLNSLGRLIVHRNIVRAMSNRLRLEDLLTRHPEIHDEVVQAPIVVLGLPRSGTTHLVNLIASDVRLRSLPYWESLEPVPAPGEGTHDPHDDPRRRRCAADAEAQDALAPYLRAMHHMTPDHVHEEVELAELDLGTYLLEWNAMVPDWRDYYLSLDLSSSYRYLATVLKALQWLRGPRRWVLKSPQHLEQIPVLLTTFPDATIAMTHRDPVSVITSAVTMLAYGDRVRRRRVEPEAVAHYWTDRVERLLQACVRDRDLIPEGQAVDVLFHEFMADDIAMVERIYDRSGLQVGTPERANFAQYMENNRRGVKGRVAYDLERHFGVRPDELRDRFGFYIDRFDVRVGA